jgi:hypothetical protein
MPTKEANGAFAVAPGTPLLGEIITWSCPGLKVKYAALVEALREAKLDEKVARKLAPRYAFARACKKLSKKRIIRQVSDDEDTITFQFTQESKEGDRFEYALETMLTLEKNTGKVSCKLPGLATEAQELLDDCVATRNGGDVTRVIQRLFERNADLFPVRDKGGCYFVPQHHSLFVGKIDTLVQKLSASMRRFPVPAGTEHGDRSVKEAVASGIQALIAEHNAAVESFGSDTSPAVVNRAAERIKHTRFKLEAYSVLLAEERSRLERDLSDASRKLRHKVEALTTRDGAVA